MLRSGRLKPRFDLLEHLEGSVLQARELQL